MDYPLPTLPFYSQPIENCSDVLEYLTTNRQLPKASLVDYKLLAKGLSIVFPSYCPEGILRRWKCLSITRDSEGKKQMYTSKESAPILFGWQSLAPNTTYVVITEGEIDAITLHSMGLPALSIPSGCRNLKWIDYEWHRLKAMKRIWLCMDADTAGYRATEEIALKLYPIVTHIVDLGVLKP